MSSKTAQKPLLPPRSAAPDNEILPGYLYDFAVSGYNEGNSRKEMPDMRFTENRYDVFQMFNDRWALVTAGSPADYNTMTIA